VDDLVCFYQNFKSLLTAELSKTFPKEMKEYQEIKNSQGM